MENDMTRKKNNSKPEQNLIINGKKKAIGYVRVSTEEQGADNKFLRRQHGLQSFRVLVLP